MKSISNDNKIIKISELKPNPENPRGIKKDAFERLQNQIKKLGQFKPVIIDTRTGYIVGGHMRFEAYKKLGITDVWVSYIETPNDAVALEYMLADNDRAGYYEQDKLVELTLQHEIDQTMFNVDLGEPKPLTDAVNDLSADFDPAGADEQGRLDRNVELTCPDCGYHDKISSFKTSENE